MIDSHHVVVPDARTMRSVGARIGALAARGDVIVLAGDLGAGKTTLTQGIAAGMGIEDQVTSPTFVIARVHVHPHAGPDLIHVDAYRLASLDEVVDLDLESEVDYAVTVVEWGEGKVDMLHESRLVVRITRTDVDEDDTRVVAFEPVSGHWLDDEFGDDNSDHNSDHNSDENSGGAS